MKQAFIGIDPGNAKQPCLTPEAIFHIHIEDRAVTCKVDLPMALNLNAYQAKQLQTRIHDAMESVLSDYFSIPDKRPPA